MQRLALETFLRQVAMKFFPMRWRGINELFQAKGREQLVKGAVGADKHVEPTPSFKPNLLPQYYIRPNVEKLHVDVHASICTHHGEYNMLL